MYDAINSINIMVEAADDWMQHSTTLDDFWI